MMSADNWRKCPRCERLIAEIAAAKQAAIVSAEKANNLAAYKDAQEIVIPWTTDTLAEYQEFYWNPDTPGSLDVIYGASCRVCGLDLADKHTVYFADSINSAPKKKVVWP